jgi:hypothetical protein
LGESASGRENWIKIILNSFVFQAEILKILKIMNFLTSLWEENILSPSPEPLEMIRAERGKDGPEF